MSQNDKGAIDNDIKELIPKIKDALKQYKELKFRAKNDIFLNLIKEKKEENIEGNDEEEDDEYDEEFNRKVEEYEFDDYDLPENVFIEIIVECCKKKPIVTFEEIQECIKKEAEKRM